jgi:ankyrin repeat protein
MITSRRIASCLKSKRVKSVSLNQLMRHGASFNSSNYINDNHHHHRFINTTTTTSCIRYYSTEAQNPLQRKRQEKIDTFFKACETADLNLLKHTINQDISITEETILAKGKVQSKDYENAKNQPEITSNINALMYVSQFGFWEILQELLNVNGKNLIAQDMKNKQQQGGFVALHSAIIGAGSYVDYLNSPNAPNLGVSTQDQDLHHKRIQMQLTLPTNHSWLKCIQLLLENGVDVNVPFGETDFTPLMYAARHGMTQIVKLLLDHGADPNHCGSENQTALNFAANYGKADTCQLLVGAGADPFHKDKNGDSFVSLSQEERQPYTIQALGSFISRNKEGKLSSESVKQNRRVWFPDLTTKFESDESDIFGNNAVMAAAATGNLEAVGRFIEDGINPNAINILGWTPLVWALISGSNPDVMNQKRIISRLISAGADPNLQTNDGLVPLSLSNNPQTMKILIEEGKANVNIKSPIDGSTPLVLLLSHAKASTDCLKLLINNSADVNAELADGTRAISFACLRGHAQAVELLIRSGAEYINVVHKQSGNNLMLIAASHGYFDVVRILVQNNMDVNFVSPQGFHTMFYAVHMGHEQTIALLLNLGVDVNIHMHQLQITPLHVAVMSQRPNIVKLLLEYEANVHVVDVKGITPLEYAKERDAQSPSSSSKEIVQILEDHVVSDNMKKKKQKQQEQQEQQEQLQQ